MCSLGETSEQFPGVTIVTKFLKDLILVKTVNTNNPRQSTMPFLQASVH